MQCQPQVLLNRQGGKPKISIILIDWGVRESFHSLHYLNRQTADRRDYELIWLEFYNRQPEALRQLVAAGSHSCPVLDKWIVLGYPDDLIYHKHRLYNVGILAAEGAVCVICDSDAIFRPTFITNLIQAFEDNPNAVIHVDEVRNDDRRFHPFRYPALEEVLGPGVVNWHAAAGTTRGLDNPQDKIHQANYGACMAARRQDLLALGGADEHLDYLGYVCGPYDLTFRLVNYGRTEYWLPHEYLYHVWHPNASGYNTEYHGPHDGMFMSLRALDALARERTRPYLPNPWVAQVQRGTAFRLERFLELVAERAEPTWEKEAVPVGLPDTVYWVNRDHQGFNIFLQGGVWYALELREGAFDPRKARQESYRGLIRAETKEVLLGRIDDATRQAEAGHFCPLCGIRRRLRAQPLRSLPAKIWKKARQLLAACCAVQPPWETNRSKAGCRTGASGFPPEQR